MLNIHETQENHEKIPKFNQKPLGIQRKTGPVVTVLIPTFNRRRYLAGALASVVHQNYQNIQIIVINDGGEDISDIVNSFGDQRLVFINRKENCGR